MSCFEWPTVQTPTIFTLQWHKTFKNCKSSHLRIWNHPNASSINRTFLRDWKGRSTSPHTPPVCKAADTKSSTCPRVPSGFGQSHSRMYQHIWSPPTASATSRRPGWFLCAHFTHSELQIHVVTVLYTVSNTIWWENPPVYVLFLSVLEMLLFQEAVSWKWKVFSVHVSYFTGRFLFESC